MVTGRVLTFLATHRSVRVERFAEDEQAVTLDVSPHTSSTIEVCRYRVLIGLETSYGTEEVGPALWERDRQAYIAEHGLTTGSISSGSTSGGVTFTAEWHGLPEEVAAVVFYQGGEAIGWQRPVGGTAAFQFRYGSEQDPLDLGGEMVALTASGDEWERYELFPG